jgi:hypothetical protein
MQSIRKSSEYRKTEFERRQRISVGDFTTFIVNKEDLIISKLSSAKDSHSQIQFGDVRNLLRTGYDAEYVARWTRDLELVNLLKECVK